MRTRYLVITAAALLALGLGIGCKKQGAEKKDPGAEAKDTEGMRGMRGMRAMDAMDAMDPDRPAADPMAARDAPPPRPDAAEGDKGPVAEGVLTEVKGAVEIRRSGAADFEAATKDAKVYAKDSIRVGKDGEASLALWDNSTIELPPESAITVNASEAVKDPAPSVTLMAGAARFDVNPRTEGQGPFAIYTPSSVVSVQGTTLAVGVGLSGASRIAVEIGKVELVPVANVGGAPVLLAAGRLVVVPLGKPAMAPAAYQPANAGWDEWLEAEDKKGAANAGDLAATYAGQVDGLAKDDAALEAAGAKADDEAVRLTAAATAAQQKNDTKAYVLVQPRLASNIEMQAALRDQRRLVHARLRANAYLLGLMRARIQAGVYKVPAPALARIDREYARAHRVAELRRQHALQRSKIARQRTRNLHRAYYLHTPRGRALAPKLHVEVPTFYSQAKLRPRLRRAPVRLVGYNRPVYRRPVYRGKYQPYRPVVVVKRPGQKPVTVPTFRARSWDRQPNFKKVQEARFARQKAQRAVWQKQVSQRRAQRWVKRPDARRYHRMGGPGMAPPPHGMGPGPDGMGPGRFGMGRGPDGMGRGPDGMGRGPDGRGPRGRGPMARDPKGMGPHGQPGMPVLDEIRRRRMERRNMGRDMDR